MSKKYLTLDKAISFIIIFFTVSMSILPVANAGLLFFDDRAEFELASGLNGINEDFENTTIAGWGSGSTAGPLNSLTNEAGFSIGDIQTGLNVSSSYASDGVAVYGDDWFGNSKTVGALEFSASTILNFDAGVQAIGLDLFSDTDITMADVFNISLFGWGDFLLGETRVFDINFLDKIFFGVISDDALITEINFNSQNGYAEALDNLAYGNIINTVDIPEPSSAFLLLTALTLITFSRKKLIL